MPRLNTTEHGVRDWALKREVCGQLLGALTDLELAETVLTRPQDQELVLLVADCFRKWKNSRPTKPNGPRQFWDALVDELGCESTVTGLMLIDAGINRFIEYLPENRQKHARNILADIRQRDGEVDISPRSSVVPPVLRAIDLDHSNTIRLHHMRPVETVASGFRAGKIDIRHYYLDPDSANAWSRLVRAEAYPSYDQCRTGLRDLLDSEPWNASLAICRPITTVMLAGGGAPTKDLLLMRNLLKQSYIQDRVHYHLMDISPYMLIESWLWISEHSRTIDGYEKIDLGLFYADVLDLTEGDRKYFHEHGKVIFGITGGTVGNFSEAAFFRSLDHASEPDDLLVISADTIDGIPSNELDRTLIHKYNHPDFRRFIRPVVRAAISESKVKESADSALDRIKVTLRPGGCGNPGDVPESWSVIVTLEIDGREITLVTSTRYESPELIAFAAGYGWEPVCQIPSPLDHHFMQFLFRRNGAETFGIRSVP